MVNPCFKLWILCFLFLCIQQAENYNVTRNENNSNKPGALRNAVGTQTHTAIDRRFEQIDDKLRKLEKRFEKFSRDFMEFQIKNFAFVELEVKSLSSGVKMNGNRIFENERKNEEMEKNLNSALEQIRRLKRTQNGQSANGCCEQNAQEIQQIKQSVAEANIKQGQCYQTCQACTTGCELKKPENPPKTEKLREPEKPKKTKAIKLSKIEKKIKKVKNFFNGFIG